ncbi:MAG: hypothetical protein HUU10_13620 [Bacteroidetes bacterium]|nr:hypothetical protein [Bacteroidota bacterium]
MKITHAVLIGTLCLVPELVTGQSVWPEINRLRNDQLGSQIYRRESILDGNLVRTLFYNNSEVAQWPFSPSGEWPKGTGINYVDGICMLVAAEAIAPRKPAPNNKITPVETYYREEMDRPLGVPPSLVNEPWGWTPVPNYANPSSSDPAMSNRTGSWPAAWPEALGLTTAFNGQWYGYFGRNIFNAELETFFVTDDSKDAEWTFPSYGFYPIKADIPTNPADPVQWYNPNIRKGLGLRVETRGFQWSHVLAEDIIFWHYDIVNLADEDYASTYFGFYTDTGLGGDADNADDWASYDENLDLTYGFDKDGKIPGRVDVKLGVYGYAYLESPGNSSDGINNDNDTDVNGVPLIDERRDDGIDNDKDWKSFVDENGNGVWDWDQTTQIGEALLNDVGADGAGPFDEPYDEVLGKIKEHFPDLGEGDGLPTVGEPNFEKTDKDESDQIGLTAVAIEKLDGKTNRDLWPRNDDVIWARMSSARFDTSVQNSNIQIVFSSGPFLLRSGINLVGFGRERFSMGLVFAEDYSDLVFNKKTVQFIYNNDYNFTKPPLKPRLTAIAGDKQVKLLWDTRAEDSTDPVLGYQNNDPKQGPKKDFEGYLIYRSTEPEFQDIKVITDSKGQPKFWKPIAQFDKVDGIIGPDPVGINGAAFWRGDDTGLQHSYIDNDVINGRTYYYAVVSYDEGFYNDTVDIKLQPAECTKIITTDLVGTIQFIDQNCAVVTPNAPAAGYVPAGATMQSVNATGTGSLKVTVFNPSEIKENAIYTVKFQSTGTSPNYVTDGAIVTRLMNGVVDSLGKKIAKNQVAYPGQPASSLPFDGLVLEALNDTSTALIDSASRWIAGDLPNLPTMLAQRTPTTSLAGPKYAGKYMYFSSDYRIEFSDTVVGTSMTSNVAFKFKQIPIKFRVFNVNTGQRMEVITELADLNRNELKLGEDRIFIVEYRNGIKTGANERWPCIVAYGFPGEDGLKKVPGAGDVFRVKFRKKFFEGDTFTFTTESQGMSASKAKSELDNIRVVPNPYIGGNIWEPRNLEGIQGRGERRIAFTRLPMKCTIRIYNMAGTLVKTLEKDSDSADGSLRWNLLSEDGTDVAFGVYIYHVDAPGVGEKIGKFALIK